MTPQDFIIACRPFADVSHETLERLKIYVGLLEKWQAKINLVSAPTLKDVWRRHILDSAQLLQYIKKTDRMVDFGSGAGFPALVLSIMGVTDVTMIESDQRKGAFMREVIRATGSTAKVLTSRIEQAEAFPVDIISARAFAGLSNLLGYAAPWWQENTKGVFLKGRNLTEELTEADSLWHMKYSIAPSLADADGQILIMESAAKK